MKLKKPMGIVFEEYNTVAKGIFVAVSLPLTSSRNSAPVAHCRHVGRAYVVTLEVILVTEQSARLDQSRQCAAV